MDNKDKSAILEIKRLLHIKEKEDNLIYKLECVNLHKKENKFYNIYINEDLGYVRVIYGRIGSKGREKIYNDTFPKNFCEVLKREKIAKGYKVCFKNYNP